jgi:serine/threonine protein kinase
MSAPSSPSSPGQPGPPSQPGKTAAQSRDKATSETISIGTGGLPAPVIRGKEEPLPQLPNYEMEAKLGEGGMGAVYRARQRTLDRTVAIKVLPERLSSNGHYVARLNREARVLAKLNHQNVITCYDMGEHQGALYVVMEFVEGENLGSLIEQRGSLLEKEALHYLKQAIHGLDHAQALGIIHRDIKPENMLLAKAAVAGTTQRIQSGHTLKIADLGLATFTGESVEDTRLTAAGATLGSPHYMSPEQTIGEANIDLRTDIYALGVTLFHMLTGQTPFSGPTVGALLALKLSKKIPDPRSIKPELTPQLSLLIQKMTARDRNDRYTTYGELLEDIEALEQHRPLKATPLSDDRAGLVLLPATLDAMKMKPAAGSSAPAGTAMAPAGAGDWAGPAAGPPSKTTAVVIVAILLAIGAVVGFLRFSGNESLSPAANPSPAPKPAEVPPPPPVVVAPPVKPSPAATFETVNLIDKQLFKEWTPQPAAPNKLIITDEGAFAIEATKGWAKAEHSLPALDYNLSATLATTIGADAIEIQVGIGDKEYLAIGLRMKADEREATAYIERRKTADDSTLESLGKAEHLDADAQHHFRLGMIDGEATYSLNNKKLGATRLNDAALKPLLRIAVRNGIGSFHSLEISQAAGSK